MQLIKATLILFILGFLNLNSLSQISYTSHNILNNDTTLNALLKSGHTRSVAFFFPTAKISKSDFDQYVDDFITQIKSDKIDSLQVFFIFFKQDLKSNTKGLKFINSQGSDTLFINYMKCLFIGFDSSLLIRAKSKMDLNFEVNKPRALISDNVFNVELEDTNVCIDLLRKIPVYADLITESINPNFSDFERINFLSDSLNMAKKEIEYNKVKILELSRNYEDQIQVNNQLKKDIEYLKSEILKISNPKGKHE
jgi:hypothetical protein